MRLLKKQLVSVVIPLRNEEENVVPLVEELMAELRALSHPFEIVAVDDASSDNTFERLAECADRFSQVRVIQLRVQGGQSSAMQAGIDHAHGEIICTMDGDLQNDPKDFGPMIAKLEEGYDFVAGWRESRQDSLFTRKLPSVIANRMIRKIIGFNFQDLGCSTKVFTRAVAKEIRLYGEMHRVLSILIAALGFRFTQIPVNHRPRVAGKSKYGLMRTAKVILDVLLIKFFHTFRSRPLHFFGGAGLVSIGLASLFFLACGGEKFLAGTPIHRNPMFVVGVFFSETGLQFLLLGFLAEMMVRNYFESTGQSTYRVKTILEKSKAKKVASR